MNNEFNDHDDELEDLEGIPMINDGHLSDEDILILINVGFDEPAEDDVSVSNDAVDEFDNNGGPVGSIDLGEEWYPNQRAFQILRAMDPTREKVEYALRDLIIEIREQSNGDWMEARRLLRIYGLEITVEYAPLSDTETVPEGDTPTSSLFIEMKRRQGSLLSRDR
ncbi:MAG: hypothetical protein ACO230_11105, partial [Ilumatobacteraceae bacterium]